MIKINKVIRDQGIELYVAKTATYELTLANVGATIFDLKTLDKDNNLESIVLKIKQPEGLFKNEAYFGTVVGRNAGRIKNGKFSIDGKEYSLPLNDNGNNSHSSGLGISHRIMNSKVEGNSVIFTIKLLSTDDKFPGDIDIKVTYVLKEDNFKIVFEAISNEDTICNMTNHSYFNLSGDTKRDIRKHNLDFSLLKSYWDLDSSNVPKVSKDIPVNSLEEFIDKYQDSPQRGMDHPFLTKSNKLFLSDKISGRKLTVNSSYNVVVLYTQNWELPVLNNKTNQGIAIEFQRLPNEVNLLGDKSGTILRKNTPYKEWTEYIF